MSEFEYIMQRLIARAVSPLPGGLPLSINDCLVVIREVERLRAENERIQAALDTQTERVGALLDRMGVGK